MQHSITPTLQYSRLARRSLARRRVPCVLFVLCAIALFPRSLHAAGPPAYQPPHANLTSISALADPNADRIAFWDDSAGQWKWLIPGANLTITDTTIDASGGGGSIVDLVFSSLWNGVTADAPSKNSVYDWGHLFDTDDDGKVNVLDLTAGLVKTDGSGVTSTAVAGTDYAPASHSHTGTDLSSIDISADTNLAGTANEIVLTDDTLSVHADIARDTEVDAKVSDTAYDATAWDGVTTAAPSMNAVRDKIESMGGGGGPAYTLYRATLTQTGTSAPAATVLQNTLGGTPTWGYTSAGVYTCTLTGAFTANKTSIILGPLKPATLTSGSNIGQAVRTSTNVITLRADVQNAANGTSGQADTLLVETSFEIRVDP